MLPGSTSFDHADQARDYCKVPGDVCVPLACLGATADLSHLLFGELGVEVRFSLEDAAISHEPSLAARIGQVLRLGSQEEVVWSDASTDVAAMADDVTRWNSAKMQFPTDPMGCSLQTALPAHSQYAITAWRACSNPQPTVVGLVDLLPKAISKRSANAGWTAKSVKPFSGASGLRCEKQAAGRADTLDSWRPWLAGDVQSDGTATASLPTLAKVGAVGADRKVPDVDAARFVARVAQDHAGWDRVSCQFPGDQMSAATPFVTGRPADDAVAVFIKAGLPQPAIIRAGDGNFLPETVCQSSN